ncbi:MAG TPA: hypothetical protein VH591_21435 [Ktedonobacterales bacterium]|jgi:hypothetical protein
MPKVLSDLLQKIKDTWKPTAITVCGVLMFFCWPTLQSVSARLAQDMTDLTGEKDPFVKSAMTVARDAFFVTLAVFCELLLVSAIVVLVSMVIAEVRRQHTRIDAAD